MVHFCYEKLLSAWMFLPGSNNKIIIFWISIAMKVTKNTTANLLYK